MTSPVSRSGDINLSSHDSKIAKKLRILNVLKISLAVIGVLTVVFGIGFGIALNPLLFALIGVGALMIALSACLTYLARKIKTRELQPPEDSTKGTPVTKTPPPQPPVGKTPPPETPVTRTPTPETPAARTFKNTETRTFFRQNFVPYAPPTSTTEGPFLSINVQIKQPGHSTRRSYKVAGSKLVLHCLQGDPTLATTKGSTRQHAVVWGYLKNNGVPISIRLNAMLRNSVTPESWAPHPSAYQGDLTVGSTSFSPWLPSQAYIEKAGHNGRIEVSKEIKLMGQLILPHPGDYQSRPGNAFSAVKQAFLNAILESALHECTCNIITFPLPKFDPEEEVTTEWQCMIERALLEAIQESGSNLDNQGDGFHVVIIHPGEEPFSYPLQ